MKPTMLLLLLLLPFFMEAQSSKDSLVQCLQKSTDPLEQFDLLIQLLKTASSENGQNPEYEEYIASAKKIAFDWKNDSLVTQLCFAQGDYYLNNGSEVIGLAAYFRGVRLAKERKDSLLLSNINYKIGAYYYWKDDFEQGLSYFEEAILAFPRLQEDQLDQARNMLGKAVALQEIKRFEESMIYHQKALAIKQQAKAFKRIPISLNNIAGLNLSMGDTAKAMEIWNESIVMADSLGLMDARTYAEYVIGSVLAQQGKHQEAVSYFDKTIKWWEEMGAEKDLLRAYPVVAQTYSKLGLNQKAIDTYQKSHALREEHYNTSKLEALQELETQYQTDRKVLENENLRKTNQLVQTRNTQYLMGFAIVSVSLLLLWLFFVQLRRSKRQLDIQHKTIEEQNSQLTQLDEMKTNFFSNITHEFRTPLTLIAEPLRQLLKKEHPEEVRQKLKLAQNNSEKLLYLVNQLLDVSKLEAGKMSLDLRKGQLLDILEPIFQSFQPLAQSKGIDLLWSKEQALPSFYFDTIKVEKIFYNLLSNAIKFTHSGRIEVALKTTSSALKDSAALLPFLVLQVKDTGIGIPTDQLDQIFERFYQVDASRTRKAQGTGIGLALCKELVELMGGSIEVSSEVGAETVFTVRLPMNLKGLEESLAVESTPLPGIAATETKQRSSISTKEKDTKQLERVLVIEDNVELLGFIEQSLQKYYQIEVAVDGAEGINKAKESIPDLIISDLMMPQKDGFEVVEELKNDIKTSHVPIVLLTAKTAIESKLTGLRKGADDYLTKPFNTEELLARMANLIAIRKTLQEKFAGSLLKSPLATKEEELLSNLDKTFLEQVRTNLEVNLSNKELSVENLSQMVFMSRSQLFRKLKALTGQTPSVFIRSYRLDQAMEMLKAQKADVPQVALDVGFEDTKYFSKRFKQRFGQSPYEV